MLFHQLSSLHPLRLDLRLHRLDRLDRLHLLLHPRSLVLRVEHSAEVFAYRDGTVTIYQKPPLQFRLLRMSSKTSMETC